MKRVLLFSALALVGIVTAGLVWYNGAQSQTALPAAPSLALVATEPVRVQDVPVYLDALGTVVPMRTVRVRTQVSGELLATPFKEGARVRKGQVLAVIDSRELQAKLKQAKGSLLRDQALLKNARLDLDRLRSAVHDGTATQQALDTQQALVEQYKGNVLSDQGLIDELNVQIEHSRIRSPIAGRIGLRQVDPGNLVTTGDSSGVAVVESTGATTVVFSVPEDQLSRIVRAWRRDRSLTVQALSRDKKRLLDSGTVMAIDNRVDTTTGTVNIKARFDNKEGQLYANQFVNVRLQVALLKDALLVPSTAVRQGRGGRFLFTVDGAQTAVLRRVEAGTTFQGYTVISGADLKPGELVIADGADRLEEHARVKAQPRAPRELMPEFAAVTAATTAAGSTPMETAPRHRAGSQTKSNAAADGASTSAITQGAAPENPVLEAQP